MNDSQNPDVVWTAELDGKYTVEVLRTGPRSGNFRIREGERLIHERPTGLSYGAQFGPDVDDVATWQDWAVEVIDAL